MLKLSKEMVGVDIYGNKGTTIHLVESGVCFSYKTKLMVPRPDTYDNLNITTEMGVKYLESDKFDPKNYFGMTKKEIIAWQLNRHRSCAFTREKCDEIQMIPFDESFEFDYLAEDGNHEKLSVQDLVEFFDRILVEVGE